jgi:hypothetical protein
MRARALFVSVVALVTVFALVVPVFASYRHPSGGSGGSMPGTPDIEGIIGEVDDHDTDGGADALRYVGDPAPDGFSHTYQWADPFITTDPDDGPVTFTGTLDLSDRTPDTVAAIGLVELAALASGGDARDTGALIYIFSRQDGSVRIGLTDGRAGGEIVQTFIEIPAVPEPGELDVVFTVDGTADPEECRVQPDDPVDEDGGCMTLRIDDADPLGDSYGTIKAVIDDTAEFADGAVPGWEMFQGDSANIAYDFSIDPATVVDDRPDRPKSKWDCKRGGWREYGHRHKDRCMKHVMKRHHKHHGRHGDGHGDGHHGSHGDGHHGRHGDGHHGRHGDGHHWEHRDGHDAKWWDHSSRRARYSGRYHHERP